MAGYISNIINLITDNLSNRYRSGFPILKELLQNADDSEASHFIFGLHEGFPTCQHPLLQGPGFWCLNDGKFKESDKDAIRRFAENAKAGDSGVIGKYGLGMKSVFHWCESLFYIAFDNDSFHAEFLNPWDDNDPEHLHADWDEVWKRSSQQDTCYVQQAFAELLDDKLRWFLVWVPLRQEHHLRSPTGERYGAIVDAFPGDSPDESSELTFLRDPELPIKLGELLPLLKNLQEIEFSPQLEEWKSNSFITQLETGQRMTLPESTSTIQSRGHTKSKRIREDSKKITFLGNKYRSDADLFQNLKIHTNWPKSRYRNHLGKEDIAPDKSSPEGAVLISRLPGTTGKLTLQWAVFLPLEEQDHLDSRRIEDSHHHYHIVLHGQFFIDSGRRGIHAFQELVKPFDQVNTDPVDGQALRTAWNQALAQQVCLPLLLPTLNDYVVAHNLGDKETGRLTSALHQVLSRFAYLPYVCRAHSWFRELTPIGGNWRLHNQTDLQRVLPLPASPQDEPNRPWEVLPRLAALHDTRFIDNNSDNITSRVTQWDVNDIQYILQEPTTNLFAEAVLLDYFQQFLTVISPMLGVGELQHTLMAFIRKAITPHGQQRLRGNALKVARVLGYIAQAKRWRFGAAEEKSKTHITDAALRVLWKCNTGIFPVPAYLDVDTERLANAKLDSASAEQWIEALQPFVVKEDESALLLTKTILEALDTENRKSLLRTRKEWKVISVYSATLGKEVPVSYKTLDDANQRGNLFAFASMGIGGSEPHDKVKHLAACLPDEHILVIRSKDRELIFEQALPTENDEKALLISLVTSDKKITSDKSFRRHLLEKCNDTGFDINAKKGLRYLLHANHEQINASDKTLWINAHQQSPAWEKLWRKVAGTQHDADWQVIDTELVDVLPRRSWSDLKIEEIKPEPVLKALSDLPDLSEISGEGFTPDERTEILSAIPDKGLWRKLPWHETTQGNLVAIDHRTYRDKGLSLPEQLRKDINLIIDSEALRRKSSWIELLDDSAAIMLALSSEHPGVYVREILTWLEKTNLENREELRETLKKSKWLVLANNHPASPEDIIRIPNLEAVIQQLAASTSYCYASDRDLAESIHSHPAYMEKVQPLFATKPDETLEKLALLMSEAPSYAIGEVSKSDKIETLAKALTDCDAAPGWAVIRSVIEKYGPDDCRESLIHKLSNQPEQENILQILSWLQKKPTKQAFSAYAYYLRQIAEADYAEALLPEIKLLADDGKSWMSASELCCDAPGVDKQYLLSDEHYRILRGVISSGGETSSDAAEQYRAISDVFTYLSPLERLIRPTLLGLLYVLLGQLKNNSEKTNAYLYPYSVDTLLAKLGWQTPDMGDLNFNKFTQNWTLDHALDQGFRFDFAVKSDNEKVQVTNLLGNVIFVPLQQNIDNFIIKNSNRTFDHTTKSIGTKLLFWDKEHLGADADVLTSMVKNTCVFLWTKLYGQHSDGLNKLWEILAESQQLDIAVTRRIILNHAAFYLNTLGASKQTRLQNTLRQYKECETRTVEAERNDDKDKHRCWQERLENTKNQLTGDLSDPGVAAHVLAKVKERLEGFQYEPDGILFELFQNADDAVLELARCENYPRESLTPQPECSRFCVQLKGNTLYILHWGRPINYRGNEAIQAEWPGFAQDLEKMLIVSASDKPEDKQVTGRFGLGFKSVFLVCDEPKIISGDLRVKILAGFLPESWAENSEALEILRHHTQSQRYPGTLIALPLQGGIEPVAILKRFEEKQAMLCMVAKTLRQIEVNDSYHYWQPLALVSSQYLEFGKLNGNHYIVYRDQFDSGLVTVVLDCGARGFTLHPKEMPTFWVVAPTRETAGLGFVISAPFRIDAGRGKLAGEGLHDKENQALTENIGKRLGNALAELYLADWDSLHQQLQLAQDVTPEEWWTSLWKQFGKHDWQQESPPYHLANAFIRGLLRAWSEKTGKIPSGLPSKELVTHNSVHYAIPEIWLNNNAIDILGQWQLFTNYYPMTGIVTGWILNLWREITNNNNIAELGLHNVIEILTDRQCSTDSADILGRFYTKIYIDKITPDDGERKSLGTLKFLSKADRYQPVGKLLCAKNVEMEESRRVNFAPDEHCLSERYHDTAILFFRACRTKTEITLEDLQDWFIRASENKQQAALRYILEGEKGSDIAQHVRVNAQGKWFANISMQHPLLNGWNERDKEEIVRRLGSSASLFPLPAFGFEPPAIGESSPQASLAQIHHWWENGGRARYRKDYLSKLYPQGRTPNLMLNTDGSYDRGEWMLLFSIGVFQRLGRVRDFGTRGFIEYLQAQGWWNTFCTNPKEDGDAWLNMLFEYSESHNYDEEYSYWMTMLPNLFKIALKLDDYVNLFEGIQYRDPKSIPRILIPNLDTTLQGAGFGHISPINRSLGKGFNLVIRELLRAKVINNEAAHNYAYIPVPRVKRILTSLDDFSDGDEFESSQQIYNGLCESLSAEKAIFGGDFDIPLLVLASNKDLFKEICGHELPEDDELEESFA